MPTKDAEVLGAQLSPPAGRLDRARAFVLAAAGLAIVLLGLAALPATALEPRLAGFVAERRVELMLAGTGVLLGAVLAYFTGAG